MVLKKQLQDGIVGVVVVVLFFQINALLALSRWILARRGPGRPGGLPLLDGCFLWRLSQRFCLNERHLHQEGDASGGRQHLEAVLLQQCQRLAPLPPASRRLRGGGPHLQLQPPH